MKNAIGLLLFTLATTGCPSDDGGELAERKGQLDEGDMVDGLVVTLEGSLAQVSVDFVDPVPDVKDSEFRDEMEAAVSLLITSNASGAAADIRAGKLVKGTPNEPGEFTWSLNSDRDVVTMSFFNESPAGQMLVPEQVYTTQFALATNEYVEQVTAISFEVTVEER